MKKSQLDYAEVYINGTNAVDVWGDYLQAENVVGEESKQAEFEVKIVEFLGTDITELVEDLYYDSTMSILEFISFNAINKLKEY